VLFQAQSGHPGIHSSGHFGRLHSQLARCTRVPDNTINGQRDQPEQLKGGDQQYVLLLVLPLGRLSRDLVSRCLGLREKVSCGPADGGDENCDWTYTVLEVYIVPSLRRSRTGLPAAQRHCDDPTGTSATPYCGYLE
jgi:hypothetical protein